MDKLQVENPVLYEKVLDSYRGGMTGNECRIMLASALYEIQPGEVSMETYRLIPKAIKALKI